MVLDAGGRYSHDVDPGASKEPIKMHENPCAGVLLTADLLCAPYDGLDGPLRGLFQAIEAAALAESRG